MLSLPACVFVGHVMLGTMLCDVVPVQLGHNIPLESGVAAQCGASQ